MLFYFSGTGNTKWIASQISRFHNEVLVDIGEEMIKSDNSFTYSLAENEIIGFIFPVYSWAPPKIVLEFIQRISFLNFASNYLFFVCSCGDDIGLTKTVFQKAAKQKGWMCNAGFSVIMPNNYVLMKGFNTDPKPVENKKLEEAIPKLQQINEYLYRRLNNKFDCIEGNFAFIKTYLINPLFNKYQITAKPFYATDKCISCKKCQYSCPVKNVQVEEKPSWGDFCTSCLACYHVCPEHAVQYGKATFKKGHYFNPNV